MEEVIPPDELVPGQVFVKIEYSGICGAQINEIDAVKGPDQYLPHLLGHEGVGTVLERGPGRHDGLHWRSGCTPLASKRGYSIASSEVSLGEKESQRRLGNDLQYACGDF